MRNHINYRSSKSWLQTEKNSNLTMIEMIISVYIFGIMIENRVYYHGHHVIIIISSTFPIENLERVNYQRWCETFSKFQYFSDFNGFIILQRLNYLSSFIYMITHTMRLYIKTSNQSDIHHQRYNIDFNPKNCKFHDFYSL